MEGNFEHEVERVRQYLETKHEAFQNTLATDLKLELPYVDRIMASLEQEGFIETHKISSVKRKDIKISIIKHEYKLGAGQEKETRSLSTIGKVSFDSPCFLCKNLENCGTSTVLNHFNCPKLNEWISKPI
nr:hypothetical protein [Candidatus Sigynarchaeota archaeon]